MRALAVSAVAAGMLASAGAAAAATETFSFVDDSARLPAELVVIDSRAGNACANGSVTRDGGAARCLPIAAVTGPHGRLASFRDIHWRLGTLGLDGSETVLIVGDRQGDRDAVGALLFLAGQRTVLIWSRPIDDLIAAGFAAIPGKEGEPARTAIYQAPMRDARVVLRGELQRDLAAGDGLLLDGRRAEEYWGEAIRGLRGGHLPGAQSLPVATLRAGEAPVVSEGLEPVLYGHGPIDGLAYLTAVTARHGQPARVYLEGYAEWAGHGLPLESETQRDIRTAPGAARKSGDTDGIDTSAVGISVAFGAVFGAIATASAFTLARRRRT